LLNLCLQVGTSFTANNRRKRPSSALNQSSASSEASASLSKLTTAMVALSNAPLPAAASADQFDTFAQFIAAEMRGCANPAGVRAFKQEVVLAIMQHLQGATIITVADANDTRSQ